MSHRTISVVRWRRIKRNSIFFSNNQQGQEQDRKDEQSVHPSIIAEKWWEGGYGGVRIWNFIKEPILSRVLGRVNPVYSSNPSYP